jgi:hypothetical protein
MGSNLLKRIIVNKKKLLFAICLCIAIACTTNKNTADTVVYITNTGNKYHTSICRYLGKSSLPISLMDACNGPYGPCSDCDPPLCQASVTVEDTIVPNQEIQQPSIESKRPVKATVRCSGTTKKGKQCKRQTKETDGRCFQHKK